MLKARITSTRFCLLLHGKRLTNLTGFINLALPNGSPRDAMSAKEKTDNPSCVTTGGYLRENDMAEEWRKAYASASPEDIQAVRDLPGFDPDVFFQITGLDLRVPDDEITINGVVYVKKPNQ
jgi:hypothetical protein